MNRSYALVWNLRLSAWSVAPEHARRRGKGAGAIMAATLLSPLLALAADLPSGGQVVSGSGAISTPTAKQMVIDQASNKLAIDWQSFDIGAGNKVTFQQPGRDAIALNRVLGSDGSKIMGQLDANGRVFLINPNGVLFGADAQVNVGGLVASTLDISNSDFEAGNYRFKGDGSNASVTNNGTLTAADGGSVALLGGTVSNNGVIVANQGSVALAAGNAVTLDFAGDGLLNVQVDEAVVDALVENRQLIKADGGQVLLTANAGDALLQTVVNNTGVIQARTLGEKDGKIALLGDFDGGTVQVAGTLDASAPDGGNGGFIDTSGAHVKVTDGAKVTTKATTGKTGTWLIDPTDFTVSAGNAGQTSSGIGATTLSNNLQNTSVTLATVASGSDEGDINVNAAVSWSTNTTLTLNAHGDINLNAAITATGDSAGLKLNYGGYTQNNGTVASGSDYHVKAPVILSGSNASLSINGNDYTLIRSMAELDALDSAGTGVTGHYALAQDLDASGTTYNQALVGTSFANAFTGTFTGLGHTISNLTINSATQDYIGLFGRTGSTSQIRDIGLVGGSVTGNVYVGALVGRSGGSINNAYATGNVTGWGVVGGLAGFNDSGTISNAHATGNVTGIEGVGGLLGVNHGIISNVYATGNVNAETHYAGGLVGKSAKSTTTDSTINNAYATGNVTGGSSVGGLVGDSSNSTISNAHATGSVKGNSMVGGLVGQNFSASISNAFATGNVTGAQGSVGGLAGYNGGSTISNAYATGDITAAAEAAFAGGLVGNNNFGTIRNVYATGNVTGGRRGVGGLLGYSDDGSTLSYAYASGSVTSSGSDVGGLIGENYNSTTTAIFYATTDADGNIINNGGQATGVFTGNANGEAKTWGELTNANTYSGWDNSIWVFTASADVEGYYQGMPYLVGVTREQDIAGGTLFQSGWGTTQSPYSITNWLQLANIGNVLNGGYYFSLSNNLDQDSLGYTTLASATANAGAGWNPLGNIANPFTGTFDGLSHTISDLTIARSDTNNVGLFGYTGSGSVIRNIGLVGGSVSGRNFVGGLVGYNSRGTISNAYVTGSVSGNINVGGLVGVSDSGTIRNAYTTGSILGSDYVGGLVGYNVRGSINNAYTTGSVSGRNFVGGLVGYNSEGAIGSAYATGSVLGSDNVGGLIGYNFQATISNAYATGNVSGNSQVGGLVGLNNSGTISSSFYATTDGDGNAINGSGANTGAFTGNGSGAGKTWAELTQASTFTGWDIATTGGSNAVWRIYNGHSGPMLRSFLQSVTLTTDASGGSKTYDGTAATGTTTYTSSLGNALDTSKLLGNLSYTSNSKNAGTYNSTDGTLTLSGLYSGQQGYDISYTDTSLAISKADLAINGISALNKTYDATTAATLVGSASVKVLGADVVAVTGTGVGTFADKNAGTNKAVTVTGYALSGTDADNYNIVLPSGLTADIDKAALAVTALDASKTYDGLSFSGGNSVSYSGLVNGEDASVLGGTLVYAGSAQGAVNAGIYDLSVSGLTSGNYAISYNTGSLNVDKAAATVTANSGTVTYNGQQQGITGFTASGLVNGETASVLSSVSTTGGSGINAGTYTHSASGTDGNYALTFVDGALTIDKAALTVTAADASKTYDGLAFTGGNGVSYNGLVNGEDASVLGGTLVYDGSAQGAVNAGLYDLSVSGLTSGNYAISYNAGSLNVGKAAATVTANSGTSTYNGQQQNITGFTATGLVNGETADVLSGVSTLGGSGINAGTYTHSASGTDGNYSLTFVDGALTIDKAALTVTAADASKTYDGLAFTGGNGVTYSGFVNGEDAGVLGGTLVYGGSAQGAVDAGLYDLSVSGLTSGNYAISYNVGSLNIDKAQATVTANSGQLTYNGQQQSITGFTASGLVNGETADVLSDVSTTGGSGINAGTYTHSASGTDGNYALTFVDGALTIDKAALTVTAADASKTYDGLAFTGGNGVTYSGFVNGEDAGVLGGTLVYGGSAQGAVDAGLYDLSVSGLTSGNYAIRFLDGSLTINAQRQAALPQAYGDALAAMQPTRDSALADLPSSVIDLYQVADSGIRLPEGL